ncbi:MAG: PilX N-terminal domain-containing pilus assembly protein [Acidobacteriota bacterium]
MKPDRGFALVGALLLLFLLSGMVAALTVSGQTEIKISQNYAAHAKAQAAAEAGLNHATTLVIDKLTTWSTDGYASPAAAISALLKGPDGLTGSVDRNADNGSLENLGSIAAQRIPRPPTRRTLVSDQWYEARVFDEDDASRGVTLSAADITRISENNDAYTDQNKRVVVRAIGYGPNHTQVTLEAIVGYGVGDPAILINGDLEIAGNVKVLGSAGGVHANGDLDITGNPDVAGDATASGTYSSSGHPTVGGVKGGGYPTLPVPTVSAIAHKNEADYILTKAGKMTNLAGTTTYCSGAPCGATGWSFKSGAWEVNSDGALQAGIYFAETDVTIGKNCGSDASPATVTIISEGSISVTGNPTLAAKESGLLFLADGDISIKGNLTQKGSPAQILVHEQIEIAGNPTLIGQILVENGANTASLVTVKSKVQIFYEGDFTGNFEITYNGGLGGASGAPTAVGWRKM